MLIGLKGEPWQERAACRSLPLELFYPKHYNSDLSRARAACRGCPVRTNCGETALRTDEPHGIWGGMTPRERKREQRKRAGARAVT